MPIRARLLFVIPSLVANGAERQLCELVRHLDRDRFDVHVVVFYDQAPGPEGDFWAELAALPETSLYSLHKRRGLLGYPAALARLLLLMVRIRPDLVHGYMDGNLPSLALGLLLRKRVIWGIRRTSRDLAKLDPWTRRLLTVLIKTSRFVDLVIFNSEAGRSNHAAMGMKAARMEVVANGFDGARFRPDPALGAAQRQMWGVAAHVPLIGIVARLDPVKDHPTFLRAAALVALQVPDAVFVCVGAGPAGYAASLKELAAVLGLGQRVRFPGASMGMPGVFNALTGLVLASTDEGCPNVLGEAMACGVPCVTTRVGDAEALVGPLGSVVATGDAQAMAQAVMELLQEAPQARSARITAGRSRISALYSPEILARTTESLLLDLLAKPASIRSPLGNA